MTSLSDAECCMVRTFAVWRGTFDVYFTNPPSDDSWTGVGAWDFWVPKYSVIRSINLSLMGGGKTV